MATRQYVGARYVPKFANPIEWDAERIYEPLEMVTYLNNTYTSKKPVPQGIEITNKEYWVITGNYNAQVEQYRQQVEAMGEDVTKLKGDMTNMQVKVDECNDNIDTLASNISSYNRRPKICYYNGTAIRIMQKEFAMTGFRYMGQNYKNAYKKLTARNVVMNGTIVNASDTIITTAHEKETWYAIFAVDNGDGTCSMKIAPIFQVGNVDGQKLTLLKTKERTDGVALSSAIDDSIVENDVLVLTENGVISGITAHVTAVNGNAVTLDNGTLAEKDYLLIAPKGEYCYVGSHYRDAQEWRNRQDDGYKVMIYGTPIADVDYKNNEAFETNWTNNVSPMCTGVIFYINMKSYNSSTGDWAVSAGEDTTHLIPEFTGKKIVATSELMHTNLLEVSFGYRRMSAISVYFTFNVETKEVRPWGFYEP